MAITAQSVIHRVATTLQDLQAVRWSTAELVRYLNDGQRETILYRPDATSTTASITLISGARQSLPADGYKLLDVFRNSAGTKRAIRMTDRALLDSQYPNWENLTGVNEIKHFLYDTRDPTVFYVYPPAAVAVGAVPGALVDVLYSKFPTDIAEPGSGTYTAVTGNISVSDLFANALANYVLYRAYTKDSEFSANAQAAVAYLNSFQAAVGAELTATAGAAPKE